MKKYWKPLLCAALGMVAFTACEDVPEPYNIPTENQNTPTTPTADYILSQTFTSSLGGFTSKSESGSLTWTSNSRYGAIISGYDDWDGSGQKSNKPGVTYLISSAIDLTEVDSAYVVIEQAINYAKTTIAEDNVMLIRTGDYEWEELPMSYDGLGSSFTYVTQEIQIPQAYIGKTIQLALKHTAHDSYSSTWEVKSIKVAKGQAKVAGGETPVEGLVGSGTKDDPYDVPSTIKLIAAGSTATIYTKGIVSKIDEISAQYGNATFYISNDGTTNDQLKVYRCLGLGGAKFSAGGIKEGDEVIVYGPVKIYNGTPEFDQGCQLYKLNDQTSGGGPSGEVTEITCAKAVELTNALADGATSTETYAVTGYITQVVGDVSRNQQTFWMADTKNGGKIFEAYWANLPEGVTAFTVGTKVKITGQLMKYVKDGKVTPEIKNATVEILEDSGDTPGNTDVTEVNCAKAVELTNALADGATSAETYAVTGYITEVVGSVSRNQQTFWMADTKDGGKVFEAYYANLPEGVTAFKAGAKVKITGQLMKYVKDGKVTPEIKNATVEILEDGGDTPGNTDATEVNCAKAVELTNSLGDGATSAETYAVTGFITEVIGNVSRNQQSFWMADTKDGGKVFEAYYANLPDGVSKFTVGTKVKIIGNLMKYVKDGKVTPEIKNATVVILEGGGDNPDDNPDPQPGGATLADFTNGDFEAWDGNTPVGWKTASTAGNATLSQSTDAHGGSYSVCVGGSSSANKRLGYKELSLEAGTYTCSFWAKAATSSVASLCPGYAAIGTGNPVYKYDQGDDGKNKYVNDIGQTWQQVTYSFTLSETTTVCLIIMNSKTTGSDLLIDDFTITKN